MSHATEHDDTPRRPGPEPDAPREESAIDAAERRLAAAEALRDELADKYQRALADFQNYQRRATRNEEQARTHAAERVVASIVPVLDHFDNALRIDPASASAEQIAQGMRVIRDELFKALAQHGVARIEPEAGEEFDPNRHEALMRRPSDEHPAGAIVQTLQPGYALGERVVRAAKVAVAADPE